MTRTMPTDPRMTRSTIRLALAALLLASTACSRETLLEVETPDQIVPGDAATPAGAAALYAAAMGNFTNFYGGTIYVGANLYGGILTDELINARPGGDHLDQRAFNENTFPHYAWDNFSQTYTQLIRGRVALLAHTPNDAVRTTRVGRLHGLSGVALTVGGELFCNGVPLSNADDAQPAYTLVNNVDMFERSVAHADSSLAILSTSASDMPYRYLARLTKARALVNLGRYADAAAVVGAGGDGAGSGAVPTNFELNAEYSATTNANAIYDWMVGSANFGPADKEGGNGLDFRSANDPRVVVGPVPRNGQDGSTQIYPIRGYPNGSAPTRLVTGVEARMIEAEAALDAGNTPAYLAALNEARANPAVRASWSIPDGTLAPLTAPADQAARVDLLFRERAFWMYLTTRRVGDLRRLVRQYGRPADSVWPSGAYFKGGTYGSDMNITPSNAERNNPLYQGCTDRNA